MFFYLKKICYKPPKVLEPILINSKKIIAIEKRYFDNTEEGSLVKLDNETISVAETVDDFINHRVMIYDIEEN